MSLLSRSDLLELKYQALQQIAKREGIRANLKKGNIADLLIAKYPDGVQQYQPSPRKNSRQEETPKGQRSPSKRQKIGPSLETNESVQSWVQDVVPIQPSPAQSPVLPTSLGRLSAPCSPGPPHVYCFKGARRVRRELVELVNDTSMMHAEMDETEALLKYATQIYDEAALEAHDFSCLRRGAHIVYGSMKKDSTILDGTYLMDSPHREAWKAYATEQDRLKEKELEELDERLHQEYLKIEEREQDNEVALNQGSPLPIGSKRKYYEDVDEEELDYV
ncbi:hypothetical protein C0995_003847 [Termitomyces sp. Mi166|nr:hypothetical protein C0995_003847 [Termitomyces sp. Mi166\